MNLEMSIAPKDIYGIEVDLAGTIHPIIKSDNNISRVSVLNETDEDAKWETVMDYKTLDEWLERGYKVYSSNKYEDEAANIYFQARLGNIRLMTFSELSQSFKDDLLEVINTYELDDFKEYECTHFYLIRSAIILNEGINNMYSELRLPFGDDEEKYNKRLETLKKKKTTPFVPMLSPKDNLAYFKQKNKNLLHKRLLNFSVEEKRAIEKYKNEMLDELMLIAVAGNYSKDFRGTTRVTQKA